MNQPIDTQVNTSAPRLLVMVVHGTFPRGGGGLQLRRKARASYTRPVYQTQRVKKVGLKGLTPE